MVICLKPLFLRAHSLKNPNWKLGAMRFEPGAAVREASMLLQCFTHPPCCSYLVRLVLHKMKFCFFLARERESWKVFWVPPFLFVPLFLSFVTHLNSLAARNKDETRRGANSAKQITSSSWRNEGEQGDQNFLPKFWKVWPKVLLCIVWLKMVIDAYYWKYLTSNWTLMHQ